MRALTYVLALLATPLLYGLSFPPWSLWGLAWIALVPWFAALRLASTTTRALLVTCPTTLAGSYVVASWLPRFLADDWGQPPHVGAALFVGMWLATVAPPVLLFTLCYRAAAWRHGASMPVVAGAAWAATEFARVELRVADPVGLLGYSQVSFSSLVQIADATGVYGVSFAVAAVNAALAELWLAAGGHTRRLAAGGALATALAVVGLCLGYEQLRGEPDSDRPPQRLALVQVNLDLGTSLTEHLRLTHDALGPPRPALVVWPETETTVFVADEPLPRQSIAQVLGPADVELLAGGVRSEDHAGTPRSYDSAFLLAPTGEVVAHYDRQEPLFPLVEHLPLDSLGLPNRESGRARGSASGALLRPLPTRVGAAGIVLGDEAMFPRIVARRVRAGAELLVSLSSDAGRGDRQLSLQALDMARLRAIEQRRDVIRASASGPSAIIDASGDLLGATEPFTSTTLAGTVHARVQRSFYAQVGDAFAIACAVVVVLELGAASLRRRRPRVPPALAREIPPRKKIGA